MGQKEGIYLAVELLHNAIRDQHLLEPRELKEVQKCLRRTEKLVTKFESIKVLEEAVVLEAVRWQTELHERRRTFRSVK